MPKRVLSLCCLMVLAAGCGEDPPPRMSQPARLWLGEDASPSPAHWVEPTPFTLDPTLTAPPAATPSPSPSPVATLGPRPWTPASSTWPRASAIAALPPEEATAPGRGKPA